MKRIEIGSQHSTCRSAKEVLEEYDGYYMNQTLGDLMETLQSLIDNGEADMDTPVFWYTWNPYTAQYAFPAVEVFDDEDDE